MPKITAKSDSAIPVSSSSSSSSTTIPITSSTDDSTIHINLLNTLGIGPALLQQYLKLLNQLLRKNTLSITHLVRLLTEIEYDLEKRMVSPYTTILSSTKDKEKDDKESVTEAIDKIFTLLSTAGSVSDASVKLLDAAYARVDLSVSELDKLLRFIDIIIKTQSSTIEENQNKLLQSSRSSDTISSRTRHRHTDSSFSSVRNSSYGTSSISASVSGGSNTNSSDHHRYGGRGGSTSISASSYLSSVHTGRSLSRHDMDYNYTATPQRKSVQKRRRGGIGPESPLDVAIDPHEPTYCTCGQVAFGEMIACDNENCLIEWYHCQCVGVTPATRPKGKWYCPACQDTMLESEGQ